MGDRFDGTDKDPREAKLPKWAQQQFETMRMRLDERRREIERFGDPDSPIRLVGISGGDLRVPYRPVKFDVVPAKSDRKDDFREPTEIMVRLRRENQQHHPYDHDVLEIQSDGGRLDVEPQASNTVRIRVRW